MKYATKPYRRARKYTRRARKFAKKSAKPSKAFVKKVQKVIHKDAEDKHAYMSSGNTLTNFNSGIDNAGDIMQLVPAIANGSADNQRIGDEIRAKKFNIRGYLNMAIDTSTTLGMKRIAVRMMVVSPKRYPNQADAYNNATTWMPTLLKKGGSQSNFTGQIQDLFAPINTDEITKYYDRVFYLSQDNIYKFNTAGQSTVGTLDQQLNTNIRNTIKFFNINIKLRNKKVLYDQGASSNIYPVNWNPILILGYVHLDGSSPDVVQTQVGLCYDACLSYEDI